jgi:hypothetical protein
MLSQIDAAHQDAVAADGAFFILNVYSPARAPAARDSSGSADGSTKFGLFTASFPQIPPSALQTAVGPVRVRNAQLLNRSVRNADSAGLYTVVVFLEKKPGGRSIPIPFRLDLSVTGKVSGAPTYADAKPLTTSDPTESGSPAESATDSASPSGDAAGKPKVSKQGAGDSGGTPVVVWAALGVVALAVLVIAVGTGVRLGRRSPGSYR